MSGKSVAFIEPAGDETNVFANYMKYPLMGTLYLGTILHDKGYHVRIYNENVMPARIDAFDVKADVYCISALTVSANRGRQLAREIKRINPNARVIVGGIHASLVPEDFSEVADHVVFGEAESIIVDLVEGSFSEKVVAGSPMENLDDLPMVNYDLLVNRESMRVIPIMTSRGCPFDCNFCSVTKIFGKRFRMQSPERIIAELKHARKYFNINGIFFYDDNFTANRKRIRELCELIQREKLDFVWGAQVRSDVARDPELVEQMERAGCRRFYIGFESIHDETLKAMHKAQTREDIERAIRVMHGRGIAIHGMFIFGDDHDTPETIEATVDFAIEQQIDTVQFMILTPFPGTKLYEDLVAQNRLIHTRWDYYNAMFTTFWPRNMSPTRLQHETLKAYLRFYSLPRVSLDALRLLTNVTIDALTWDFSRVFSYYFETLLLRAVSRVVAGRYAKTFGPYVDFLRRLEETDVDHRAPQSGRSTAVQSCGFEGMNALPDGSG